MTKKKRNMDIDQYEKEILDDLENDKFVSVKNLKKEVHVAKKAASNFVKRDSRINIRVSKADLDMIRIIAAEEGLPYQTLLASVIHKYAAGRLVDKGGAGR